MAVPAFIENAFVNKVLQHVLDGDKGSNILGAIIVALMAANINWAMAFAGFQFKDMNSAMESAKLVGAVVTGVFAYFVGKKKPGAAA